MMLMTTMSFYIPGQPSAKKLKRRRNRCDTAAENESQSARTLIINQTVAALYSTYRWRFHDFLLW